MCTTYFAYGKSNETLSIALTLQLKLLFMIESLMSLYLLKDIARGGRRVKNNILAQFILLIFYL